MVNNLYNQELEGLADPLKKEVNMVRKKIDSVNKQLKPLGHTCQKKVQYLTDNFIGHFVNNLQILLCSDI